MPYGNPIDVRNPVNRAHSLNRGRAGWWLGLPGQTGGQYLYDLAGQAPGLLVTPSATGVRWITSGVRPGRLTDANVYINQTGTANRIDVGNAPQFQITGNITVGCWARYLTLGAPATNRPLIAKWGAAAGYVLLVDSTTANKMTFGVSLASITKTAISPLTYNDDAWHRFIGTYDGANVTLYADGLQVAQTGGTGAIDNPSDGLTFGTYSNHTSSTTSYVGHLDDLFVSGRAWSATEVMSDYDLSRRGYPSVLRRGDPSVVGGAGVSYRSPWWQYATQQLIGAP